MSRFGHDRLNNRFCFEGRLELQTPLRLSSGRASEDTDASLMRFIDGTPYIPGSTLRGALRSEVERILSALNSSLGPSGCVLFAPGSCDERLSGELADNGKKPQGQQREEMEIIKEFVNDRLCSVCCLFGFPQFASRLIIKDALPVKNDDALGHIHLRDGVGIDRDTGSAKETVKFTYEVMEPGPAFGFQMVLENLTAQDRPLVDLILELLHQGFYVGGKRAVGLGYIKLKETEPGRFLRVTGFTDPQVLWDRLQNHQEVCQPLENWQEALC